MKFLFVGGPEHGRIKEAHPSKQGGVWIVAHVPPLTDLLYSHSSQNTFIEQSLYRTVEMILFGEKLTVLTIDGRQDSNRMLDVIIKPEVRDLMRRI